MVVLPQKKCSTDGSIICFCEDLLIRRIVPILMCSVLMLHGSQTFAQVNGSLDVDNGEGPSFKDFVEGNWFDPPGKFWQPRKGPRTEFGLSLGGEAGLTAITPAETLIPDFGGSVLTPVFRYYPVNDMGILIGGKNYVGFDEPAAGTAAGTVITPFFGVRYDLVQEARFSLSSDIFSGPAFFVFADVQDTSLDLQFLDFAWALGSEISAALVARYALGPVSIDGRMFVGGRAGSAQAMTANNESGRGLFSTLYAGLEIGFTFSFWQKEQLVQSTVERP